MYIHNKNGDIFRMTTCLMIISIPDEAYVVEIDNKMPQKHFTTVFPNEIFRTPQNQRM